jgi:hypothetical protein
MKKLITSFFSTTILLISLSSTIMAQVKPVMKIATVKQKSKTVSFTITASEPFRMGSNRYILHIGNKEFFRSTQSESKGHGTITFMIPADDYKHLPNGKSIFLTCGHSNDGGDDLQALSDRKDPNCWPLGKFSKKLLTR